MKRGIWAGCAALFLAAAVGIVGCKSKDGDETSKLIGLWNWSSLVINGMTLDFTSPELIRAGGSTTITPAFLQSFGVTVSLSLEFEEDNTATGSVNARIPGRAPFVQTLSGTWSVSGDQMTVQASYEGQTYRLAGTWAVSGTTLTLAMTNRQLRDFLEDNGVDLATLAPQYKTLIEGLSGSVEFTR